MLVHVVINGLFGRASRPGTIRRTPVIRLPQDPTQMPLPSERPALA